MPFGPLNASPLETIGDAAADSHRRERQGIKASVKHRFSLRCPLLTTDRLDLLVLLRQRVALQRRGDERDRNQQSRPQDSDLQKRNHSGE